MSGTAAKSFRPESSLAAVAAGERACLAVLDGASSEPYLAGAVADGEGARGPRTSFSETERGFAWLPAGAAGRAESAAERASRRA